MVVVCFTTVALFTGCGTEQTTASTSNREKVITIAISKGNQESLLDQTDSRKSITYLNYELIYDPLVNYGEDGSYEPGLAESWDISPDGTEYTLSLIHILKSHFCIFLFPSMKNKIFLFYQKVIPCLWIPFSV